VKPDHAATRHTDVPVIAARNQAGIERPSDAIGQPGEIGVADASAETDLKGLEPVRKQLPDHLCIAVASGNERADADVVVGIHGESVEYNPASGKICVWTQSDLKSE
jgi:hypothetical protein